MNLRNQIFSYPFSFVAGQGLGVSNSSLAQFGEIIPSKSVGRSKLRCYVNGTNGNLVLFDRLFELKDRGESFKIGYVYNSQETDVSKAWRLTPTRSLLLPQENPNYLVLIETGGHRTPYRYSDEEHCYIASGLSNGTPRLSFDKNENRWVRIHPETNVREIFKTDGTLEKCIDSKGNVISYDYDDNKDVIAVHMPSGVQYDIERNQDNAAIYKIENHERTLLQFYRLDEMQRVIESHPTSGNKINYHYNQENKLYSVTQSDNTSLHFQYKDNKISNVKVGEGEEHSHHFSYQKNTCVFTDANKIQTEISLDDQGRLQRIEKETGCQGEHLRIKDTIKLTYADSGHIESITYPDQGMESFQHDKSTGLLKLHKDKESVVTIYLYHQTSHGDNVLVSKLVQGHDTSPRIEHYIHDENVNERHALLRFTISPQGRVTEKIYNSTGLLVGIRKYLDDLYTNNLEGLDVTYQAMLEWQASVKNKNGLKNTRLTTFDYDESGRLLTSQTFAKVDDKGQGIVDQGSSKEVYEWSVTDQLTLTAKLTQFRILENKEVFNKYQVSTFSYDGADTLLEKRSAAYSDQVQMIQYHPKPGADFIVYPDKHIVSSVFDQQGDAVRLVEVTTEGARKTEFIRAANNELRVIILPDQTKEYVLQDKQHREQFHINELGYVTENIKDNANNYEITRYYVNPVDIASIQTPDNLNIDYSKLRSCLDKQSQKEKDRCVYKIFDLVGRVRYVVDEMNYLVENKYDEFGNVYQTISYGEAVSDTELESLLNNNSINRVLNRDKDRIQTQFYDKDNLKIAEQNAAGFITTYEYDAGGRLITKINLAKPDLQITCDYSHLNLIPDTEHDAHHAYFYDNRDQCIREIDAEGYVTENQYRPDGKKSLTVRYETPLNADWALHARTFPEVVAGKNDRKVEFVYDELGRLSVTLGPLDQVTSLTYDKMGRQISSYVQNTNNLDKIDGDHCRGSEKKYDELGRLVAEINPLVAIKLKKIDLKNELSPEEKKKLKDEIWQSESERYVYQDTLKTQIIDSLGNITRYYYDAAKRPILIINPHGSIIENTYNAFGEIVSKRSYAASLDLEYVSTLSGGYIHDELRNICNKLKNDKLDPIIATDYNNRGQIMSKEDPEQTSYRYHYNAFGECYKECFSTKETENQLIIRKKYDKRGLLKSTKKSSERDGVIEHSAVYDNLYGHVTSSTDENGYATLKIYDKLGRLKQKKKEIEKGKWVIVKTISYDAFDRIKSITNQDGHVTQYIHNEYETTIFHPDKTTETIRKNIFSEVISKKNSDREDKFEHNATGLVSYHKDAEGRESHCEVDGAGRIINKRESNGSEVKYIYEGTRRKEKIIDPNGLKLSTSYQYNALGDISSSIDSQRIVTTYAYNKNGLCKEKIVDPQGKHCITTTEYNAYGSKLSVTEGNAENKDIYTEKTEYDQFNRPISKIVDPDNLKITAIKHYDNKSHVVSEISPKQFETCHIYDGLGRKRYGLLPTYNGGGACLVKWEYTDSGLQSSERVYAQPVYIRGKETLRELESIASSHPISNDDTLLLTRHDVMKRPRFSLKVTFNEKDRVYAATVLENRYDEIGNLTLTIEYAEPCRFNAIDDYQLPALEAFAQTYISDDENRITRVIYNKLDKPILEVSPTGVVTEKNYNEQGLLIAIKRKAKSFPDTTHLASITDIELHKSVQALGSNDKRDFSHYFIHDSLGRITHKVNSQGIVKQRIYDHRGNIISKITYANKIIVPDSYLQLKEAIALLIPDKTRDQVINKKYDVKDRVIETEDAKGNKESIQYIDDENKLIRTDKNNHVWIEKFDTAKRVIEKISPVITVTDTSTNEKGKIVYSESKKSVVEKIEYDAAGNMVQITHGYGLSDERSLSAEFDAHNNIVSLSQDNVVLDEATKSASFTEFPTTKQTVTSRVSYDNRGRKIGEMNEKGKWTTYVIDAKGQYLYTCKDNGRVIRHTYNSFGNEIETYEYATRIEGSTSRSRVEEQLKVSSEDRVTKFEYDKNGSIIKTEKSAVFFFSDGQYGLAKPETVKYYNALGKCIKEKSLISPGVWAEKFTWYDVSGEKVVAELDQNNYLTTYSYNTFGKRESRTEYASSLSTVPPLDATDDELQAFITPHLKDRHYHYQYDLNNNLIAESQEKVVIQKLSLTDDSLPEMTDVVVDTISHQFKYDNENRLIATINEQEGVKHRFHNARGQVIGETKLSRTRWDEGDKKEVLTPLVTYGVNAYGQRVRTTHHKHSYEGDEKFNPDNVKKHDEDQTHLSIFDQRGLPYLKQDAEDNITGYTYDACKEPAREFYETKIWDKEDKNYNLESRMDEKRFYHDSETDRFDILKEGVKEESSIAKNNIFGEPILEGDDKEIPLYKHFDGRGYVWLTNASNGAPTLKFYNLNGFETLEIKSPSVDFSLTTYSDLKKIMDDVRSKNPNLECTYKEYDKAGRFVAFKTPYWREGLLPSSSLTLDRWGNKLTETNTLGYITSHEYNHKNQILVTLLPETTVVNERGISGRIRPKTMYGYDKSGSLVAVKNPNGNTEGHFLDEAGQQYLHVLEDGTKVKHQVINIFGQADKTINAAGKVMRRRFDRLNQITELTFPSGRTLQFKTDRFGNRILYTHDSGGSYHMNHDARKNVSTRYEPLGHKTEMEYDRNHLLVKETLPNNGVKEWGRDYFGLPLSHSNLSGEQYHYIYDLKRQLRREYTDRGLHGSNRRTNVIIAHHLAFDFLEGQVRDLNFPVYDVQTINQPHHDIRYDYSFGLNNSIFDVVANRRIIHGFTLNGLCNFQRIENNDGHLYKELTCAYDELDREFDTKDRMRTGCELAIFAMQRRFDANGDVRYRDMQLHPATYKYGFYGSPIHFAEWFNYDKVRRVSVLGGNISEGIIQPFPGKGVGLEYKNNQRYRELVKMDNGNWIDCKINYDDDGRITSTHAGDMDTDYRYWSSASKTMEYFERNSRGVDDRSLITWDDNFAVTHTENWEKGVSKSRTSITNLSNLNLPHKIVTVTDNKITDEYLIDYVGLEDYHPSYAHGTRNGRDNSEAAMYYSNEVLQGKEHCSDEHENNIQYQYPTTFDVLPDKRVIAKQTKFEYGLKGVSLKGHYFFHSINLGVVGLYQEWARNDLFHSPTRYSPCRVENSYYQLPNVVRPLARRDRTPISGINELSRWADVRSLIAPPRVYIVRAGDTFTSIAKQTYGEEEADDQIAETNGFLLHQKLSPGQVLFLPQYAARFNKYSTAHSYSEFLGIIGGSIAPFFPALSYERKTPWWKMVVLAIIITVAVVAAIKTGQAYIIPYLIESLGAASVSVMTIDVLSQLVLGVMAALGEAAGQGIAMMVGVKDHFSLAEAIQTGIATGFMAGDDFGFIESAMEGSLQGAAQAALAISSAAVSAQLTSMALGIQSKFEVRGILEQVAATITSSLIARSATSIHRSNSRTELSDFGLSLMANTANDLATSTLGLVISHRPINWESLSAHALGAAISNEVIKHLPIASKAVKTNPDLRYSNDPALREMAWEAQGVIDASHEHSRSEGVAPGVKKAKEVPDIEGRRISRGGVNQNKMSMWGGKRNNAASQPSAQRSSPSASETLIKLAQAQAADSNNVYSFESTAGPIEKAATIAITAVAVAELLPASILAGLGTIGNGLVLGGVSEAMILSGPLAEASALTAVNGSMRIAVGAGLAKVSQWAPGFFERKIGAESAAARRAYLDTKFGRTGDLHLDINFRGYMSQVNNLDVATLENQAVFYSGDFGANRARAEMFARETGRLTLEMTPGGKYLDNQRIFKQFERNPELAVKVWSTLSERFAQQASGEIHAFAYNSSSRSIFNQVELKALEQNPNVSNIMYKRDPWLEHDPYLENRAGFRP